MELWDLRYKYVKCILPTEVKDVALFDVEIHSGSTLTDSENFSQRFRALYMYYLMSY